MKKNKLFTLLFLCIQLCTCTTDPPQINNKDKGSIEACIDTGCPSPLKSINCEDAFGTIQVDPSTGGKILNIIGRFPNNSAIQLTLVWDGNLSNSKFSLDNDNVGIGNWGMASFFPVLGQLQQYITINGSIGTVNITSYSATNQRISGSFSFKGQYFNGTDYQNGFKDFSGSFTNIPIIDPISTPQLPCAGGSSGGPGGGTTGDVANTSVSYKNATFTDIDITVAGLQKIITRGSTVTFSGKANTSFSASASTSGKTSNGTQVGSLLQWTLNGTFPSSGTLNTDLNITKEYFYLKLINTSNVIINKIFTNYGLVSQTTENLTIQNNGNIYGLGYYKAFSNSNVRAESGNNFWTFPSLGLPFSINQSVTLTAQ